MNDDELPDRLRRLVERAQPVELDEVMHRRPARGGHLLVVALAGVAVLALVAGAVALLRLDRRDAAPITTDPPATTVPALGDVPAVWYDARGLHHGDVVEQTPVEIGQQVGGDSIRGALALVRSGAVYLDPATGDVWFHPWGGEPRIVGHNSAAGPGGDPNGDTAAWFEGTELVVYDTAIGREISRTEERGNIDGGGPFLGGDHYPAGNGFLQVSAERVVWTNPGPYSHDLRTGRTSEVRVPEGRYLADLHDDVELLGQNGALVLRAPGRPERRYPDLESHTRLSPSGNFVLAVEGTEERHAAAIVDTRTGELWRVPRNVYPWIAWSYGDIALVDHTEDAFLACDAARRACERLHPDRPFLLPTN